jgi:survival of motor neuron protein-interacting protein 1
MDATSAALPVDGEADPSLGPPLDGWEYLKQVRWEANRLPNINVAHVSFLHTRISS